MAKYQKRPVVVDAFQLGIEPIPDWAIIEMQTGNRKFVLNFVVNKEVGHENDPDARIVSADVFTLEGTMHANYGDYIIKGVSGELYPCKPDIFHKTYESVAQPSYDCY